MGDLVLLGAGASVEAGVPAAFELTEAIRQRLDGLEHNGENLGRILDFVCERLSSDLGPSTQDVERVFSAIEMLSERETLEVSPFVERWGRDAWRWRKEIGVASPDKVYAALRDRMLTELRELVATTRKQISYLEPLVRVAADPRRATIATLNYDLSVEGAGEAAGIEVHTGINHWVNSGGWDWPKAGVRLLKLHGSIDWTWEDDLPQDGRLPSRYVRQVSAETPDVRAPAMVFGLRGKLRAEGPFLSLLAEFESHLEMASRLVVIGYSFRDDHVNQAIRRWTFKDRGSQIVLIDPGLPAEKPRRVRDMPFRDSLLACLDEGAPDGCSKTRLKVIREPASIGIRRHFEQNAEAAD
jgi:SIR2-like domain